MASIDDVIERSQKPGEFTERREFTVARGQAIKKLREFALVNPYYCVLELIQSSVANGATYIDIRCDDESLNLSYIGGSFRQTSLAQLFDFLFAAEGDVEHGALRQLALGVNALLDFEPEQIIIETGDGTLQATTRIIIGDDDTVQVGTPEESLDGTYLRATGMNWESTSVKHAITERCLVTPVPILFNHDPLFGYSSQRTPDSLFGFRKTVSFDEGDLYGTIGVANRHSGAVFRMLTYGVWIESTRHEFTSRRGATIENLGGVVTFDRLHKTADHSAIVRDGRYEEMWLRLQPYVNQLVSGETEASSYDVQTLAGDDIDNQELLELLRGVDSMVLVPPKAIDDERYGESARAIGESLNIPVLCVGRQSLESVQVLGGHDVDFILCNLEDEREIEFYTRKEADLPPRPWLISPTDLGRASLTDIAWRVPCSGEDALYPVAPEIQASSADDALEAARKAAWLLGAPEAVFESRTNWERWKEETLETLGESIRARIYTPERRSDRSRAYNVEVRTARRVVWQGDVEAVAPGQVLIIDVSDLSPKRLWSPPRGADKSVAQLIAEAVIAGHVSELETAADRGLKAALRADLKPGTNAAQLVLASVAQRVVKRIRSDDADCRVGFSVVDPKLDVDVLDAPVLKTLAGADVSLRDLEALMEKNFGLVYAVRTDIEPRLDGLNDEQILVVDEILEDLLISLVGPTAYVRIDERDVVAESDGVVCRDVAVGLREYPDFPLLVEGSDPTNWPEDEQQACLVSLVEQLVDTIRDRARDGEEQELRRQAWRHLQWFALRRGDDGFAEKAGEVVDELPLYRLTERRTCSTDVLRTVVDHQGHVEMLDGWAVGAGELTMERARWRMIESREELWPFVLRMNPFVLHLLGASVAGAAEYSLSQKEIEAVDEPKMDETAMLERVVLDDERLQGVIGVPMKAVERPAVIVFGTDEQDTRLREDIASRYGVVGKVRLRQGVEHEQVEAMLSETAGDVLSRLLVRFPEMSSRGDEASVRRALEVLLTYVSGQVQLIGHSDMTIEADIHDRLGRQIAHAPLLPGADGLPVSPITIYHEFLDRASQALAVGDELDFEPKALADNVDDVVETWLDEHFQLTEIHRPGCYTDQLSERGGAPPEDLDEACLEATLEYWINAMYPAGTDQNTEPFRVRLNDETFVGDWTDEFCQLRALSNPNHTPVLELNPEHRLSRWVMREGQHSQRPIAWALLAAYAHIHDVMEKVTGYHEMICQRRVAEALEEKRLTMRSPSKTSRESA